MPLLCYLSVGSRCNNPHEDLQGVVHVTLFRVFRVLVFHARNSEVIGYSAGAVY